MLKISLTPSELLENKAQKLQFVRRRGRLFTLLDVIREECFITGAAVWRRLGTTKFLDQSAVNLSEVCFQEQQAG